jgi:hypothetical protein
LIELITTSEKRMMAGKNIFCLHDEQITFCSASVELFLKKNGGERGIRTLGSG